MPIGRMQGYNQIGPFLVKDISSLRKGLKAARATSLIVRLNSELLSTVIVLFELFVLNTTVREILGILYSKNAKKTSEQVRM